MNENISHKLDERIKALAQERGVTYSEAFRQVEAEAPELVEEWIDSDRPRPDEVVESQDELIKKIAEKKGLSYSEAFDFLAETVEAPVDENEEMVAGVLYAGIDPELTVTAVKLKIHKLVGGGEENRALVMSAFGRGSDFRRSALKSHGWRYDEMKRKWVKY